MRAINPVGLQVVLTAGGVSVGDSMIVRLVSTQSNSVVVSRQTALGAATVSFTVTTAEPVYLFKDTSDVVYVSSNTASGYAVATPVTFMY